MMVKAVQDKKICAGGPDYAGLFAGVEARSAEAVGAAFIELLLSVNGSPHSLSACSMAGAGASRRNMWHK
jgi:hypothetical protein